MTRHLSSLAEDLFAPQPSPQQRAIYAAFQRPAGHLLIRARAGTGKTHSIVNGIGFAPEISILLCAFNKKIQLELEGRLKKLKKRGAVAKTLHGVGYGCILAHRPAQLDEERGQRLAEKAVGGEDPRPIVTMVRKLAAVGKNAAPFPTLERMIDLAVEHDLEPDEEWEEEGWHTPDIARLAMEAMDLAANDDGTIDFDDMVFVPVRNGWVRPRYQLVVVDEAQDMNASQLILATKSCISSGRVIVVGDDAQSIYGFRGADHGTLDRLKRELRATEFPLTVTFRCPRAVVEEAQRLVPDFTAAPSAPAGEVLHMSALQLYAAAGPGDFILSRTNAPLAKVCLQLLVNGKRALVEGREIGQGLLAIIDKLHAPTIAEFLVLVATWRQKQLERIGAPKTKAAEKKIESICDQAEALTVLGRESESVPALRRRIETMFQETDGGRADVIVCSSIHKSKGLERDRVFLLDETLYPGGRDDDQEERNIAYVGITRAKKTLVHVVGIVTPAVAPAPSPAAAP